MTPQPFSLQGAAALAAGACLRQSSAAHATLQAGVAGGLKVLRKILPAKCVNVNLSRSADSAIANTAAPGAPHATYAIAARRRHGAISPVTTQQGPA